MQNQEAIEDLMAKIRAAAVRDMCAFCTGVYPQATKDRKMCWFGDAANPDSLAVSLIDLTSAVGRQRVEECANPEIVQMVLEIQSLAAGSDNVGQ